MKQVSLSSIIIYAVGSAANSAALFIVVPFLINTLNAEEYGAWSIFEIAIFFINMLILAGLEVGLMREYWQQTDETLRARLVGTVVIAVSLLGMIITGIGVLMVLSGIGGDLPGSPLTLILVLAIGWSDACFRLILTVFRIREQPWIFITLSFLQLGGFALLLVGFLYAGFGLIGALTARLLSSVSLFFVGLVIGRRFIQWRIDQTAIWRIARYGLPLLPTNIAAYILLAADRYVIQYALSLEAVAIYTFAYKIATILDVFVTRPFAMDWAPRRFKIATQPDPEQSYVQILLLYLWVATTFGLIVMAVTPFIYKLIAPVTYWSGIEIVSIILLAYIIYGLSFPLNVGIMLKDRTQDLPIIGAIAAVSCLGLYLWWIPIYGINGAAWATVVSYLVWTGLIAVDSLRIYPIKYPLKIIGGMIGCGILAYGGLWWSNTVWPDVHLEVIGLRVGWVVTIMGGLGIGLWRYVHRKPAAVLDHPLNA